MFLWVPAGVFVCGVGFVPEEVVNPGSCREDPGQGREAQFWEELWKEPLRAVGVTEEVTLTALHGPLFYLFRGLLLSCTCWADVCVGRPPERDRRGRVNRAGRGDRLLSVTGEVALTDPAPLTRVSFRGRRGTGIGARTGRVYIEGTRRAPLRQHLDGCVPFPT